jgi:hypothetical protein
MKLIHIKMKPVLWMAAIFIITGCAQVTNTTHLYNEHPKKISENIDELSNKINAEKGIGKDSIPIYKRWHGSQMNFIYRMNPVSLTSDSTILTITTAGLSKVGNANLNIALTSFINQELGITGPDLNPHEFYLPPRKTKKEMWKKNMISIGYGNYYSKKDNPFINQKDAKIGAILFGLLEALHLFPIIAGPFIGETREDRIVIPIIGFGGILAWKILVPLFENSEAIEDHNNLVESGYKYPVEIKNQK